MVKLKDQNSCLRFCPQFQPHCGEQLRVEWKSLEN